MGTRLMSKRQKATGLAVSAFKHFVKAKSSAFWGPIFIHRDACVRYKQRGFPAALRELPLMLEGYGRGRWQVARERVAHGDVESAITRIFAHAAVEYIHVRNAEAGCYIALLERES
ncbi:hypothetical protein DCC62_32300 [candidate division KSB1 bacterium]|nr:MAG: hypothetical protein DCC62_32300 [candidate division KSB1 bacterium]